MSKLLFAVSSLALIAGPASALTAPELWADWQETMAKFGTELSAESEDYSDGTLVLKGMVAKSSFGEDAATEAGYGDITLIDQDDGSVRIIVPTEMTQTSTTEIDGESFESSVQMTMEGLDATVRDEGDDRIYDFAADLIRYSFDDLSGGQAGEAVRANMAFQNYDSATTFTSDDRYSGTFTGGLSVDIDVEGSEPFTMAYAVEGLDGLIDGSIPDFADMDFSDPESINFAEMGIEYDFTLTHSGSSTELSGDTVDGPLAFSGTSGGGRLAAAISPQTMSYGLSTTDVSMTVTPPGFPLPINASATEITTDTAVPLEPSDTPSPYAMTVKMSDVAVDESLWALFDPTGQLPRDPATVEIDLSGDATVIASLLDPAAMENLAGPPFLPNSLTVTKLLVSGAGIELRGSGAVEWENALANPVPLGNVSLELDGGFALLDKLVALGFVPPQQVAIARGMAGAVTEQVGDDQLKSDIEFTAQGILANGLPLPF